MDYGHFDDVRREYVITRPDTPQPWYNYIRNRDYCGLISHTGGGPSYHRDCKHRRFLRYRYNNLPADRPGRYVYLRDEETGDYWSATWAPVEKPLDRQKYECRVGLNYQVIRSEYKGIVTEMTYFVSPDHDVEIWRLQLKNASGRKRTLKTWSYAELNVWGTLRDLLNMDNNPRCTRVNWTDDNVLIHSTWNDLGTSLGGMSWVRVYGYFTPSLPPVGYDTDREMFIGPYRCEANPVVVETGKPNNHCADGGLPVAALCHEWTLEAGEERTLVFQMGVADDPKAFERIIPIYRDEKNVETALRKLKTSWAERLESMQTQTPDADFNTVFNTWTPYQSVMTGFLSRSFSSWKWGGSVGIGFRDTSQDVMGCCHLLPDLARDQLRMLMGIQYQDGTAVHGYVPETGECSDRDFLDDHLWLVLSACNYVKETGDLGLLEENIRFIDGGEATGYEHLARSLAGTMNRLGENGLPHTGHADWNDGLNPGDMESESVFVATLFCAACREMIDLAEFLGRKSDAKKYDGYYRTMKERINERAWDGEWYRRVLVKGGGFIGSAENALGSIFVEPQPWAVMSGVAEGERARQTLDSVNRVLGTEYGIRLVWKPFPDYDPNIGAISIILAGTKENGSVFHHTNPWVICAETVLGRGERAMDYFKRISPTTKNRIIDTHQVEPYVFCQWTGLDPFKHVGRGANPWITGTATWVMLALSQYILGIKPDWVGLRIDPCVPKGWKTFKVTRRFRGARYEISVENSNGVEKGVTSVTLDGKDIGGNVVPAQKEGTTHKVRVTMG